MEEGIEQGETRFKRKLAQLHEDCMNSPMPPMEVLMSGLGKTQAVADLERYLVCRAVKEKNLDVLSPMADRKLAEYRVFFWKELLLPAYRGKLDPRETDEAIGRVCGRHPQGGGTACEKDLKQMIRILTAGDEAVCNRLESAEARAGCMAIAEANPHQCASLEDPKAVANCHAFVEPSVALRTLNPAMLSPVNQLPDSPESAYVLLAHLYFDEEVCEAFGQARVKAVHCGTQERKGFGLGVPPEGPKEVNKQ